MTLKHIVAAVAAIFATGALAAGDPSHQRPSSQSSSGSSSAMPSQASGQAQSPEVVKQVQKQLNDKGYEVGAADGQAGPKTQAGLKKFQEKENLSATGRIDQQTLAALGINEQDATGGFGKSPASSSSPRGSSSGGSGSSGSSTNQPGSSNGPAKSGGPDQGR
jgi:peptidoglycan hydrolase-like protein with peptidoglycan-binding domain